MISCCVFLHTVMVLRSIYVHKYTCSALKNPRIITTFHNIGQDTGRQAYTRKIYIRRTRNKCRVKNCKTKTVQWDFAKKRGNMERIDQGKARNRWTHSGKSANNNTRGGNRIRLEIKTKAGDFSTITALISVQFFLHTKKYKEMYEERGLVHINK